MTIVVLVFTLAVYTTAVAGQHLSVTDAMAARIDAQAWRVDQLTKQFQTINDLADGARAAAKDGGDTARHLMNQYLKGKSDDTVVYMSDIWHRCRLEHTKFSFEGAKSGSQGAAILATSKTEPT